MVVELNACIASQSMAHAPNREYDLGGNWLGALLRPMKAPCELLVDDPQGWVVEELGFGSFRWKV